jgi:alpha-tubulin suppressor-like RCC1 family protein
MKKKRLLSIFTVLAMTVSFVPLGLTATASPIPLSVTECWTEGYGVIQVSAGGSSTLAIRGDGALFAWGTNSSHQLGLGTTSTRHLPTQVGTDTDWMYVSTSENHTLALKTDGSLWAWGNNSNGQLGIGGTVNRETPVRVGFENDWVSISTGNNHSMAIKTDGTLWAWGLTSSGQLGTGDSSGALHTPHQVMPGTSDWVSVSAGGIHTMGIRRSRTMWAWGSNTNGRLGNNTTATGPSTPVVNADFNNWALVSSGNTHTTGIRRDGTLWAWGSQSNGQLGNGVTTSTNLLLPTQIGIDDDWLTVSTGNGSSGSTTTHNIALKTDGTMWVWGLGTSGQLGNGGILSVAVPTQIGNDGYGYDWIYVSAGNTHSAAIREDGSLWVWGASVAANAAGNGWIANQNVPRQISVPIFDGLETENIRNCTPLCPDVCIVDHDDINFNEVSAGDVWVAIVDTSDFDTDTSINFDVGNTYDVTIEWGAMRFVFDYADNNKGWLVNNEAEKELCNTCYSAGQDGSTCINSCVAIDYWYLEPNPGTPTLVANNQIRVTNNTADSTGVADDRDRIDVMFNYTNSNHVSLFGTPNVQGRFYDNANQARVGANTDLGGAGALVSYRLNDIAGGGNTTNSVAQTWFALHGTPMTTYMEWEVAGTITIRISPSNWRIIHP